MHTLYYAPGACSLSVNIALREAGLDFNLKKVSTKTKEIEGGGDYRTINPLGYVPALVLPDQSVMTEVPVIVQYIADQVPDRQLAPAYGTPGRYRMQALLNIVGTELHKSFSPLFNPALSEDTKAVFRGRIRERLTWFDQQLSGKDYLLGQFSMADPYLFVVSNWAKPMAVDLNDLDNLLEFRKRMSERPTIQAAMGAEGLKK